MIKFYISLGRAKKLFLGVLLACIPYLNLFAQTDAQFSQYMYINPFYNPGATAIDENTNLSFLARYQWLGNRPTAGGSDISGSPVTQLVVASTKIRQINSGVGAYLMHETLGPVRNLNAILNYSYHLKLGEGRLGIGAGLGIYNRGINTSALNPNNPNDPVYLYYVSAPNQYDFDLNLGAFYLHPKYFVGLSTRHLNTPILNDSTKESRITQHIYATGGYNFQLSDLFTLTPMALVKSVSNNFRATSVDVSALVKYNNEQFWGGLSYRSSDALVAIIGVGLTKNNSLKFGYAFDLTVLGNAAKAGTSHEIMLTYSKPVAEILPKPIIRTPRYRF